VCAPAATAPDEWPAEKPDEPVPPLLETTVSQLPDAWPVPAPYSPFQSESSRFPMSTWSEQCSRRIAFR
jgi:hypothetical protein